MSVQDARFYNFDYKEVEIPPKAIVYCDPPYIDTEKYSIKHFDSIDFWKFAQELSKTHIVLVSEQTAPDDWVCIWQKEVTRTIDRNKNNQPKKIEKLFIYKENI